MNSILSAGLWLIIIGVVYPLLSVSFQAIVRHGMPDKYPDFEGGDFRLNKAIFLNALVQAASFLPVLLPITVLDDKFTNGSGAYVGLFFAFALAYFFASDFILKWIRNLPAFSILREHQVWSEQVQKQRLVRIAGINSVKRLERNRSSQ